MPTKRRAQDDTSPRPAKRSRGPVGAVTTTATAITPRRRSRRSAANEAIAITALTQDVVSEAEVVKAGRKIQRRKAQAKEQENLDLQGPTSNGIKVKRTKVKVAIDKELSEQDEVEGHQESGDQSKAPATKKRSRAKKVKDQEGVVEDDEQITKKPKRKRKSREEKEREAMPLAARTQGLRHYIGAHVSVAKGVHNGVHNALHIGGNAFAIFLKSQRKWENPPLVEDHATLFHGLCKEHSFSQQEHVLPHGSYLVNLASTSAEQHEKSLNSFLDDMKRCDALGISLYNFHPGNTNGQPREDAYSKIANAIDIAHGAVPKVTPLLETMASNKPMSNVIGGRFEELAEIIDRVRDKSRVGVCIDTCHIFAAGYDIVSEEGFQKTMEDFDRIVGRQYLRAWHLNDSKAPYGSGRDLHANIGTGFIGLRGFWNVMNMRVWGDGVGVCGVPMVLETPIDEGQNEESEEVEAEALNGVNGGKSPKPAPGRKASKEKTMKPKPVEDKGVWAREIKLLESLVGMQPDGEEFKALEQELSEKGRTKREKMLAAFDKKQEKDRLKEEKAKNGKGRKKRKKFDEQLDELSQNNSKPESELSDLEPSNSDSNT